MTTTTTAADPAAPAAARTTAMQSTAAPASADRPDRRPGRRLRGVVLAIGGVLYALSHALNLLGSSGTMQQPHEIASKVLFGAGAVLIMAGMGAVTAGFRRSIVGVVGAALSWCGMFFILNSAYQMLFVFPLYGWEGMAAIDGRAAILSALALPTVVVGPILLAIAGMRHRVVPVPAGVGMLVAVAMTLVMAGVPELQAPMAIASTIILGAAWAWIGVRAARTGDAA
jgi:hypothetical protein